MSQLLKDLCRANQGILKQKLDLMELLGSRHSPKRAYAIYNTICPIVKATMGQHIRHSMIHMERAVQAENEIHYDLRQRDTPEEKDWDLMQARIQKVQQQLEELPERNMSLEEQPVDACFMLSGNSDQEFRIPSMVGRELAFSAHHAIHHLALVKIIATGPIGGLNDADLPPDFGRAPSTVNFDRKVERQ